jgi:hypothetical protein
MVFSSEVFAFIFPRARVSYHFTNGYVLPLHFYYIKCSVSPDNIQNALQVVATLHQNGAKISATLLNIMMSSAAERGDSHIALSMLMNDFNKYNVEPNADTYSYALESMGKHVLRARRRSNAMEIIDQCLLNAETILSMMDDNGIVPTQHIVREYTELLCQADQIDTATDVVFDAHADLGFVNSKTIYRVATANLKIGKFDVARKVTALASIPIPNLLSNIDVGERNSNFKSRVTPPNGTTQKST